MQVDWEFDPARVRGMTPEELQEYLVTIGEKQRRLSTALQEVGRKLDAIDPRGEDDISHSAEVDMLLNPDKPEYRQTPDTP